MKLISAFPNEGIIPSQYTCDGANISPPFTISDVPDAARSLVLIVDDPDAPAGNWVHWLVWNIPADIDVFNEGTAPEGVVEGMTSFGKPGWGGPCPPNGEHRYFFRLYALDVEKLDLPTSAGLEELRGVMKGHILETAELMGRYDRPKA